MPAKADMCRDLHDVHCFTEALAYVVGRLKADEALVAEDAQRPAAETDEGEAAAPGADENAVAAEQVAAGAQEAEEVLDAAEVLTAEQTIEVQRVSRRCVLRRWPFGVGMRRHDLWVCDGASLKC